jgi:hypothetical protein
VGRGLDGVRFGWVWQLGGAGALLQLLQPRACVPGWWAGTKTKNCLAGSSPGSCAHVMHRGWLARLIDEFIYYCVRAHNSDPLPR